ncbi:uncharacterized protein EI97DRAFT_404116 [Westerdykella ornata]|uniref:Uncharacterized protein n=1 Tax=Westerdykella ornata TaxID=318751 RepID=A0A6A6JBE0_WESOR|nr:uncharacterized protein EI97DRAFT_404116 [Westerdykella ornata]KAF2273577.1 hypothetical protein EI97DRAFT_404116 [Westerdykella ornata]
MASALPTPRGNEAQVKNAYEAVALAVHAGMVAVGFRLVGLGEEERIGKGFFSPPCLVSLTLASDRIHVQTESTTSLPPAWNHNTTYAFRYAHSQSAMQFILKITRLGNKALIFGTALGADHTTNFEITVRDYISESSLPVQLAEGASNEEIARKLQDVFISPARLDDLGKLLKVSIIQRLAPGIYKEGYEEDATSTTQRGEPSGAPPRRPPEPEPARPYPFDDPLRAPPPAGQRPLPEPIPGFEDEYEILRPMRGPGGREGYPVGIGHDDLYPPGLGPHDPIRPHLGGGLPRPGGGMGGGMHPTFDDPLFRGQGGVGGYDARAPPGARYDPLGPQDPLREDRGTGRFPGGGGGGGPGGPVQGGWRGGGGGGPPNPFGGFGAGDFI